MAIVGATQVGCGGDDNSGGTGGSGGAGGPPDFGALETKLSSPSGTFAAGQENAVQDGFGQQYEAAQQNPFGGGGGSSSTKSTGELTIQNVKPLAEQSSCAAFSGGGKGSCACPNGGTLEFDVPSNVQGSPGEQPAGTMDQTVSIVAKSCQTGKQGIDGSIYWKIKSPPPLQIFSVHLTITGEKAGKWDVEYMNKNGEITFAVDVADGRVLVSAKGNWNKATKTGTLTVKDKNETWTCEMTNGVGKCTSDKGVVRNIGS